MQLDPMAAEIEVAVARLCQATLASKGVRTKIKDWLSHTDKQTMEEMVEQLQALNSVIGIE